MNRTVAAIFCAIVFVSVAVAQDPAIRSIAVIPAEVQVAKATSADRWNRLVLLATPAIHSGDVNRLNAGMKSAATKCALTVMATVSKQSSQFVLREVAVGYSVPIAGAQTTISSSTAAEQGADLGFIERQVLRGNEKRFAEVKQIAQTSTLTAFDAPTIFSTTSGHRLMVMRHLCWIDPRTGEGAMLVWLLDAKKGGVGGRVFDLPMRLVRWGSIETRNIHVDGDAFVFGIPSETAFGLESLPPGADIPWTNSAKQVAGRASYTQQEVIELANAMNDAITRSKSNLNASR